MADDDNVLDPRQFENIAQQWNTFLDQPGGRAALLQAGLALMQPAAWGQNLAAQIGSAIGSAGEAATRNEALNLKGAEAESKAMLREAQAGAAEARAGARGTAAELAGQKLQLQQDKIKLDAWKNLRNGYETYRHHMAETNKARAADILNPQPPLPVLGIDEWIRTMPSARAAAEASGLFGTTGVTPAGSFAEPGMTTPSVSTPTSGAPQQAPRDPAQRVPGTTYMTPKGPLKWTGQGWLQ